MLFGEERGGLAFWSHVSNSASGMVGRKKKGRGNYKREGGGGEGPGRKPAVYEVCLACAEWGEEGRKMSAVRETHRRAAGSRCLLRFPAGRKRGAEGEGGICTLEDQTSWRSG